MLRSMYSAISGLKNFQLKLDVVGNNIANVNTHGFKKGRVVFKDMVSQSQGGANGPDAAENPAYGGVNPKQVGLGAQLGAIDNVGTQGSIQSTGRPLDLAISGDGYFPVFKGDDATLSRNSLKYTRAGNFSIDEQGFVVNSEGYFLLGTIVDKDGKPKEGEFGKIQIPTDATSLSIGSDGSLSVTLAAGDKAGTLKVKDAEVKSADGEKVKLVLAQFSNAEGLQKVGSNLYTTSENSGTMPADADLVVNDVPGEAIQSKAFLTVAQKNGAGSIESSSLEMSNVDMAEEFTEMIVAQRGFQANTRTITTSDQILQELMQMKR